MLINVTHHPQGHSMLLNARHIEMMRDSAKTEGGGARIYMHGDNQPYVIKETLDQLLRQFPEGWL